MHKCKVYEHIKPNNIKPVSLKQDFFGKAPNVFIGRHGYPNINVGVLTTENYSNNDDVSFWKNQNFQINQILDLRKELLNSRFEVNVKSLNNKFLDLSKELALSSSPTDVEINLKDKPIFKMNLDKETNPYGSNAQLEKMRITENVKVPNKIQKIVDDTDLKANSAIIDLYNNFDEHYLTKLLSVGNLGVKNQRKLVPTRWSITAIDDTVSKDLINNIKLNEKLNYCVYFGYHLGNYYLILTFPDVWSYELFETHVNGKGFNHDVEGYTGRKSYAENTAGGYYTVRLAIAEKFKEMKKQAKVIVLRFVTNEYYAPLGVWVTREAARTTMSNKPIEFSSKELMLKYIKHFVRKKFNYDVDFMLKDSKLLKEIKTQKKLWEF